MTDIPLPLDEFIVPEVEPRLTIEERAERYAAANEWVLRTMIALADGYKARGAKRIGVKHLAEVIRYEHGRATNGDTFRFNNDYSSRFARMIIAARPDLAELIETRELKAA